jgi:hypothetical protein
MGQDSPFYAWSILEAWDWLANLPFLGFILLLALVIYVGLFVIGLLTLINDSTL